MKSECKFCIVMPFYNHESLIGRMVHSLRNASLPCFLINDGSRPEAIEVLEKLETEFPWLTVIHREENGGKGAAVCTGFKEAEKAGFTHALQLDADCQHDVGDIDKFLNESRLNPDALILGQAVYGSDVPKSRLYGRWITHFWVMIETLNFKKLDTMCGFRIYPLHQVKKIIEKGIGRRMDFDVEVAVRMRWLNCPVIPMPTRVDYPEDGVSHFHYLKGNLCITWMHTKLVVGMLIRLPLLLKRKCCA